MNRRHVLGAVAVTLSAALVPLTSTSGASAAGAVAETGCYDILASASDHPGTRGAWDRVIDTVDQETKSKDLGLYGPAVITYENRGIVDAWIELAAPSCTNAVYSVRVYDYETQNLIGTFSTAGDGVSKVVHIAAVVEGYNKASIGTVFVASDPKRGDADLSPDTGTIVQTDGPPAGSYTN